MILLWGVVLGILFSLMFSSFLVAVNSSKENSEKIEDLEKRIEKLEEKK